MLGATWQMLVAGESARQGNETLNTFGIRRNYFAPELSIASKSLLGFAGSISFGDNGQMSTPGTSPRLVYQQGDHVCALFLDPAAQLRAAIEYIKEGLIRGERCLYVCGEKPVEEFRAALREAGVDVESEEKRSALILITKNEGHLNGGFFDPDKMITMLEAAVKDALDAGFAGLCAAGDMNWVLDGAPGTEKLAEYESRLNRFYATHKALGLCQYNRRTLPARFLDDCIATHKHVRIDGPILLENPFYEEPEKAIGRNANEEDIQERIDMILNVA